MRIEIAFTRTVSLSFLNLSMKWQTAVIFMRISETCLQENILDLLYEIRNGLMYDTLVLNFFN